MNRRPVGLGFVAISAFLFASRYACAAIFGSGLTSWNSGLFNNMYEYVGSDLTKASFTSLLIGIAYLVRGELESKTEKR